MRTHTSEHGFTLMELLASTAISLVVIGTAMTAFKDGVGMTKSASDIADTTQNLRSGTNMLIHDLVLAGRGIPTGGVPIPSGANSLQILRPSPPGLAYTFDNVGATTMTAITSGSNKGPAVDGQTTDMVTLLSLDPILDTCLLAPLSVKAWNDPAGVALPHMNNQNGTGFTVVNIANVKCPDGMGGFNGNWLTGNATQAGILKGDLLLFTDANGANAIQTVTSTDATNVYFAQNANDQFGFNQPGAAAGSIKQLVGALDVKRVIMYTYYVDPPALANQFTPRLMRRYNMGTPQALAGVVEDLQFSFDLVDSATNTAPTGVLDLPVQIGANNYSANMIKKVSVHVGVRSEVKSLKLGDYLRSHISTVVSIRNMAFVDRYK
jgi:hypothetical protein